MLLYQCVWTFSDTNSVSTLYSTTVTSVTNAIIQHLHQCSVAIVKQVTIAISSIASCNVCQVYHTYQVYQGWIKCINHPNIIASKEHSQLVLFFSLVSVSSGIDWTIEIIPFIDFIGTFGAPNAECCVVFGLSVSKFQKDRNSVLLLLLVLETVKWAVPVSGLFIQVK